MIEVRGQEWMGRFTVSVTCKDYKAGHDHCVWSGSTILEDGDAGDKLRMMSYALINFARTYERGEDEEVTSDCL